MNGYKKVDIVRGRIKFITMSLLGIILFLIPIPVVQDGKQQTTLPIAFLAGLLKDWLGGIMPILIVTIITVSGILTILCSTNYKNKLLSFLAEYKNVFINSPQNASPHIINIGFPGVKGEVLVNAFSKQNVMVSTTSACSSKMNKLNEVLLAMEIEESKIEGSIRISLGAHTTENDILSFMNAFETVYKEIKELLK